MNTRKFSVICALLILLFGVNMAFADITASNLIRTMWGNKRVHIFDVAFDSSYNYGGEDLKDTSGASLFLSSVATAIIYGADGYTFKYDATNETVKAFSNAPPIVWEEKHNISPSGAATLDYPAAYIVSVVNSGGTAYPLIYSGATTMAANKSTLPNGIQDDVRTAVSAYAGDMASGGSTFLITYATQAWQDLYSLLVQNELLTGTGITRYTVSGNTIFAWMMGKFDGDTSNLQVIEYSDTAASDEIGVDFGDNVALGNSGITQAASKVASSSKQVYATYLKSPPNYSWLADRYVRDEDAASGTSKHELDQPLLLWLQGQYVTFTGDPPHVIVLEDQTTKFFDNKNPTLAGSGASEVNTTWGYRGPVADGAAIEDAQTWYNIDEADGTAMTHATYLFGHPWEIPNLKQLEVPNGADLSNLTGVKVMLIGR